jgi:hypothetical protein
VTYKLFAEGESGKGTGEAEDEENETEPRSNYIYIPDVVNEPSMHYFEIPRLGSYLAIPMFIKNYLNVASFDDAVAKIQSYEEEVEESSKQRDLRAKELEKLIETAREAEEDTEELLNEYRQVTSAWPAIEYPQFVHEVKKLVLCTDTLGFDREISPAKIEMIDQLARHFVSVWEGTELKWLQADAARFRSYAENEYDSVFAGYFEEEERQVAMKVPKAGTSDEEVLQYNYSCDLVRLELVKSQILDEEKGLKHLLLLAEYSILKFSKVIQIAFFLAGYKKEAINEPRTNLLNWRYVRKHLYGAEFVKKLLAYNHEGQKTEPVPRYAMINHLNKTLNDISNLGVKLRRGTGAEQIQHRSVVLAVLLEAGDLAANPERGDPAERPPAQEGGAQREDNPGAGACGEEGGRHKGVHDQFGGGRAVQRRRVPGGVDPAESGDRDPARGRERGRHRLRRRRKLTEPSLITNYRFQRSTTVQASVSLRLTLRLMSQSQGCHCGFEFSV